MLFEHVRTKSILVCCCRADSGVCSHLTHRRAGALDDAAGHFHFPATKTLRKPACGYLTPNKKEGGTKCCRRNTGTEISRLNEEGKREGKACHQKSPKGSINILLQVFILVLALNICSWIFAFLILESHSAFPGFSYEGLSSPLLAPGPFKAVLGMLPLLHKWYLLI